MLAEDFDKHKTEPIPDDVLVNLEMHISSLGYLEDGAPRFTEQLSTRALVRLQAQKFLERTRLHILKAVWCVIHDMPQNNRFLLKKKSKFGNLGRIGSETVLFLLAN